MLIQAAILLYRVTVAISVNLVYRPLRAVSRFFFYQVMVRGYRLYRTTLVRLGWQHIDRQVLPFIFSQKFTHLLVIALTISVAMVNLAPGTRASSLADNAHKTIIADLIRGEFGAVDQADEEFIVETFDQEAVISPVQQRYLDTLGAFRPQPGISPQGDLSDDPKLPTIQEGSALVKPEIAQTTKTKRPRTGIVTYTVAPGDTISTIAEEFEVGVTTILWENALSAYSIIRPGDELRILPQNGVMHAVAKGETIAAIARKYGIEEAVILETNKRAAGDTLAVGDKLLIPGGKKLAPPVQYRPQTSSGLATIKDIVAGPDAKPAAGNKMNWPAAATKITQYFSWRHTGLDIANKTGTAIYAADAGTVELAGWGSGYGNQLVIDHGGGKKTRYAHLSKFYVKKGEKVSKGETIAAMGSTGWSTGPHLHFEVIINGKKYNPLTYIK